MKIQKKNKLYKKIRIFSQLVIANPSRYGINDGNIHEEYVISSIEGANNRPRGAKHAFDDPSNGKKESCVQGRGENGSWKPFST